MTIEQVNVRRYSDAVAAYAAAVDKMLEAVAALQAKAEAMRAAEAPANYPEIAAALVGWGIDSISVNPSSLIGALKVVADAERRPVAAE
jgi:phosphoenolpyruvate synthase/pyruvate phosphate dikinase